MEGVRRFFAYARERHSVYLRRRAGLPRGEWTSDPILQRYRFTNVFRELDATTVWFRDNVREPLRSSPDVLLATVLFRWFNRISTGEAIFLQKNLVRGHFSAWESLIAHGAVSGGWGDLAPAIKSYCGKGPYVTGAYIIKTPDGYDKLSGVVKCIEWFMTQSHSMSRPGGDVDYSWWSAAKLCLDMHLQSGYTSDRGQYQDKHVSLEQFWDWLRRFPYMGDFMAYEVVTDLRHTDLLCHAPDIMTWANPGPGATRGAGRVFHGDHECYSKSRDRAELIDLMRRLLEMSRDPALWPQEPERGSVLFSGDNLDTVVMSRQRVGDSNLDLLSEDWPSWEMRDVEHTLCEFDKYERARLGQGRPRGVYR